jgi:hypothetical protein
MSNPLDGTNEKPSLEILQYIQENWGKTEIAAAARVSKVTVATGGDVGIASDIPVGAEIIDVHTVCIRTNASGTMQVKDGSGNAVTDAMTCDTDKAVTRAATIDDDYTTVGSDGIKVFSNAWNDGGIVYIHYLKT